MKDSIDLYDDNPVLKCELYDTLIEFGLYGTMPEEGESNYRDKMVLIQSLAPSIKNSRNYIKNASESGKAGGKKTKYDGDDIIRAVQEATKRKNRVPTRQEVVDVFAELTGQTMNVRTFSRRCKDEEKYRISQEVLRGTSETLVGTKGTLETKEMSPGTRETLGTSETSGDMKDILRDMRDTNTWEF